MSTKYLARCAGCARRAGAAITVLLAAVLLAGCPGPAGPQGPAGPAGATGPQGPTGADGQFRIYGDGTAGDITVAANAEFTTLNPDGNLQFRNLTVNAGVTLTVPTGGIIRCTGSFVNNGTVLLGPGGEGGVGSGSSGAGAPANAGLGVSQRGAAGGELGPNTDFVNGGNGGLGVSATEAVMVLDVRPGGGGGGFSLLDNGGNGGGGLLVLAKTSISNTGTIRADGADGYFAGSGGGGGGVIILASPGSVANTGLISASGGGGGPRTTGRGPGGGGGGGIVHFMSPALNTASGTVDVSGGAGVEGAVIPTANRVGGGGGGACGGDGGWGSAIHAAPSNYTEDSGDGDEGYVIESQTDPTPWFD